MNATQLRKIADEAYGKACSAPDDYSRGYAAGVEALARKLATGDAGAAGLLAEILRAVQDKADAPRSRLRMLVCPRCDGTGSGDGYGAAGGGGACRYCRTTGEVTEETWRRLTGTPAA